MPLPWSYNIRNLAVRKLSTALTFFAVALIVAVLSFLLSFAAGIRESLRASGQPRNLIVLKTGATAESTSIINPEEAGRIIQCPGIAKSPDGELLVSRELCTQSSLQRLNKPDQVANVAIRGVDPTGFLVHDEVRITQGRAFAPGAQEVIVGKHAHERYANLSPGGQIEIGRAGNRSYTVVGVFEAAGGAFENEIWGQRSRIADSYDRRFLSSVVLRLENPKAAPAAIQYLEGPAVRLRAKREPDYYADLTTKTAEIVGLTTILIAIMGAGAIFAVANTMYAAVDARKRELAMLRTLGFSRAAILSAIVLESVMICLVAGAVGLLVSYFASGSRQDFLSDTTWTALAFETKITSETVVASFGLALLVAVVGALAPALRASRTDILTALRKA